GLAAGRLMVAAPPRLCRKRAARAICPQTGGSGAAAARAAAKPAPGAGRRHRAAGGIVAGRVRAPGAAAVARDRSAAGDTAMKAVACALAAVPALAAGTEPLGLFGMSAGKNGVSLSIPMQVVILLTVMTLLPAAVMAMTPFLRITVVL